MGDQQVHVQEQDRGLGELLPLEAIPNQELKVIYRLIIELISYAPQKTWQKQYLIFHEKDLDRDPFRGFSLFPISPFSHSCFLRLPAEYAICLQPLVLDSVDQGAQIKTINFSL